MQQASIQSLSISISTSALTIKELPQLCSPRDGICHSQLFLPCGFCHVPLFYISLQSFLSEFCQITSNLALNSPEENN